MSDPFRLSGTSAHSATLADLDLNGRLDLITGNEPDNTLSILMNVGGPFSSPDVIPAGEWPVHVLCADLDHNGVPDLVATNKKSGNLTI